MVDVVIVGDGPGGLSAGLFLAKNGKQVVVIGKDQTPMHEALLRNYLGVPEITGADFQRRAREQVASFGAKLVDEQVAQIERGEASFAAITEGGARHEGKYLILVIGDKRLVEQAGVDPKAPVDANGRTAVERVYLVGWLARPQKIQAIISAGDGAAAALDILSAEAGKAIHDFDTV